VDDCDTETDRAASTVRSFRFRVSFDWGENRLADTLCAFNMTRRSFLGLRVSKADTLFARLRGLLGRTHLASDEGVWMVPSRGIHTVGLLFPTDVVFLDVDSIVVHVIEHLSPFRISAVKIKAHSVLELPIRTVYSSRTQVGDRVVVCTAEELQMRLDNKQMTATAATR